jgi:type IV pilus assembly protein PilB
MEVKMEQGQYSSNAQAGIQFGEWLVNKGVISHRKLCEALMEQNRSGGRLGEVLARLKLIDESQITQVLAEYLSIEHFVLDDISRIDFEVARTIPESIAKRFCLIAVSRDDQSKIILAMEDPLNVVAVDTVRLKIKQPVKIVISSRVQIEKAIDAVYHGSHIEEQQLRTLVEFQIDTDLKSGAEAASGEDDSLTADISSEAAANKAPVISFVDLLLGQAVKSRASDIHIEPQENSMSIRMRVDGVLREMLPPSRKMQAAVATRIKILSKMDIAERRLPQDGRFKIKAPGRDIDVRVSSLPTIYGEKVVMRILDKTAVNHDITKIGFEPHLLTQFKAVLEQPHGIIIVTGPTGSGKSTTLYSALNYLRDPKKNITTVEDPVEYRLPGINQVQVRTEIDLTFASCLRSILRQDPDIVLIGEIRDTETMEIAMKASLTGHLVLSTFHTNDAPSAFTRLAYMGLERYLLASTVNLVVAQRLVRKICDHCKEPVQQIEPVVLRRLKISEQDAANMTFFKGRGCSQCNGSGYSGRTPIFEFMVMNNSLREAIVRGVSEAELRALKVQSGYPGLMESGITRIKQGLSTPEEVLKVTYADEIEI